MNSKMADQFTQYHNHQKNICSIVSSVFIKYPLGVTQKKLVDCLVEYKVDDSHHNLKSIVERLHELEKHGYITITYLAGEKFYKTSIGYQMRLKGEQMRRGKSGVKSFKKPQNSPYNINSNNNHSNYNLNRSNNKYKNAI